MSLTLLASVPLVAGEQAPLLRPDFPPYAPYPGLPLNARQLQAWNLADHIEADAAAYTVYTNNYNLRPTRSREDTYARLRARLQTYTAPGAPGLHFSLSGEASRLHFFRHQHLSDNEFAGALFARVQSDHFALRVDYNVTRRVVPDEDHFSLHYRSYHEPRTLHDATGFLAIGNDYIGLAADSRFRAIDYPGLLAGRNDVIVTDNLLRLGFNPVGGNGPVLVGDPFPLDYRFQKRKGRFDARPIPRAYDFLFDNYLFLYLGTVHLLHPDNLDALPIDPSIALAFGYGIQIRIADFLATRLDLGPIRFQMFGDNSTDHPGWQTLYFNSRTVLAPWDDLELHLELHSGISEARDAAYGQTADLRFGLAYFLNRNFEIGLDYRYEVLRTSRHFLNRHGDQLLFHAAWRIAEAWATDLRIETRRRDDDGPSNQFSFDETRLLWGLVFKPY